MSINPLKKVKIDEIGDVKDNFIAPGQIEIINKPTALFRASLLCEELQPQMDKTVEEGGEELETKLKCFNTNAVSPKNSNEVSQYSEISQKTFNDESLGPSLRSTFSI